MENNQNLPVVDDDEEIRSFNHRRESTASRNGDRKFPAGPYRSRINVARRSGFDICRETRAAYDKTPIILKEDGDRIIGLKIAADDNLGELVARIETVLRRSDTGAGKMVSLRDAEVRRSDEAVASSSRVLDSKYSPPGTLHINPVSAKKR